jgi:hypothetical protein
MSTHESGLCIRRDIIAYGGGLSRTLVHTAGFECRQRRSCTATLRALEDETKQTKPVKQSCRVLSVPIPFVLEK